MYVFYITYESVTPILYPSVYNEVTENSQQAKAFIMNEK